MSAERLTALTEDGVHAPLPNPGALMNNPNAAQLAAHKYNTELYDKEQTTVKKLKADIFDSLDEEARSKLNDPEFGLRRVTLQGGMDILRVQYGQLSSADIEKQRKILSRSFQTGIPIREHIRQQTDAHAVYVTAGQAVAEADKVAHLRNSVQHVPALKAATSFFIRMHNTIAGQTFALLAEALEAAEDNGDLEATAGSAGYAAAGTEHFTMATVQQMIAAALAQDRSMARRQDTGKETKATNSRPPRNYCWTHGPCAHSSDDCTRRAVGHVAMSTLANKQGGREEPWFPNKKM
jgi:hypothetical protein